ncbi:MAG: transglycosylase SLT domain-containing protein [Chloroflexota bacterium]
MFLGGISFTLNGRASHASVHSQPLSSSEAKVDGSHLSPFWGPSVTQWTVQINAASRQTGIDPDLLASVIKSESNGNAESVSYVGAVGLMGVMPMGPGLEFRPSADELTDPAVNIQWGSVILRDVILQAGGDVASALAAYNGGWEEAAGPVPQVYASEVLDQYARAMLVEQGFDSTIAHQWTIAVDIENGYLPHSDLLVLGSQPLSGTHLYGKSLLIKPKGRGDNPLRVQAFAVPVVLVTTETEADLTGDSDTLERTLLQRLGELKPKESFDGSNPRIVIACLSSIDRLRGQEATRWYFPSTCPRADRPAEDSISEPGLPITDTLRTPP